VLPSHTILAPASATGRSPRAIVRLSGPETFPTLLAMLDSVEPIGALNPGIGLTRGAYRARFRLAVGPLPVLVLAFPSPRSYTGQDVAELLLPGNPHVVGLVCERLQRQPGVRPAAPGEFSARAYLSGRLTLEQAEAHYIQTEMIEPLIGGEIIGGFVHESDDSTPFPVLQVKIKGKVYKMIISMDDEMNGGGRILCDDLTGE
jgi:tRNA U34 5-carboxymethylaminomethyl modifying GTPase MnmE/TrmE